MKLATALLALVLAAGGARANVWQHATAPPATKDDVYDLAMRAGDEKATQALSRSPSEETIRELVKHAVDAYRMAAAARPNDPEPWFRIGTVLHDFYFFECDSGPLSGLPPPSVLCNPRTFDRKHAEEIIAAWDEFERLAPLDPRLSVDRVEGGHILFERAILHTKMIDQSNAKANKAHLEAAARDYEKIIARFDSADAGTVGYEQAVGNLAETYMMLDRLDDAVDMYREALRHTASASTGFGLAVALDRDERGDEAIDVVLAQGDAGAKEFLRQVNKGLAFFVPMGEVYYYFALIDEANGDVSGALNNWELYIRSGAHPEFQPRARAHIAALRAKHIRKEVPHLEWIDE